MRHTPTIPRFEFATAARIIFGWGALAEIGTLARDLGQRALVVTGRQVERAQPLLTLLQNHGVQATTFTCVGEPSTRTVQEGVERARSGKCELVIGFGGGSAIDAAKAISALLTNPGALLDYLEVVGGARPLRHQAAPCIAVPTTAGTGAEVTRNSVLASVEHRVKVSLRSPLMLPRIALVDPALTRSLPPAITAATGLDALTQLIEPYTCGRANPFVDALCLDGMRRVARSLQRAVTHGTDAAAREDLALASLFGGLALANAGLGAVHGFAGPLGGMYPAPHGAVCAALLPHVMTTNSLALRRQQPSSPVTQRYDEVARCLTGDVAATAEQGSAWVAALVRDLGIAPLRTYGLTAAGIPDLVAKALQASSMKANPVRLAPAELAGILAAAL